MSENGLSALATWFPDGTVVSVLINLLLKDLIWFVERLGTMSGSDIGVCTLNKNAGHDVLLIDGDAVALGYVTKREAILVGYRNE